MPPAARSRLGLDLPVLANKPVSVSVILSRSFGDPRLLTQSAIGQLCPGLSPPPSPPPPPWPRLWSCKGIENQNPNRVVSVTYIKGQFRFGAAALYNWNLRHKNLFVPQRQTSERRSQRRRWGRETERAPTVCSPLFASRSRDPFAHRENFSLTCHPKKSQKIFRYLRNQC